MEVLTYNSKDYIIKRKIAKIPNLNIEFLKQKYIADIAFANDSTIFFGEELKDLSMEETNYNDLPIDKLIPEIISLYQNTGAEINPEFINLIIKKVQFHSPTLTDDIIIEEIKNYIQKQI